MFGMMLAAGLALLTLDGTSGWGQTPNTMQRARLHHRMAKQAFAQGRHQEALIQFNKAHSLTQLPGFLFNIGQCHRHLKQYEAAVSAFRRYLDRTPEARNRKALESLIEDLEREIATEPRAAPGGTPPPPEAAEPVPRVVEHRDVVRDDLTLLLWRPRKPRPLYKKWWFWGAVALAVGGATVGVYFAAHRRPTEIPTSGLGTLEHGR